MRSAGYYEAGGWIWFEEQPATAREVEARALNETLSLLEESLGVEWRRALALLARDPRARARTASRAAQSLEGRGIRVLRRELEAALAMAAREAAASTSIRGLVEALAGKWTVFAPAGIRVDLLREAVTEARGRGIAYAGKTTAKPVKEEEPVLLYVPSFLAVDLAAEAVLALEHAARRLGVRKTIYFKPDAFTEAGVYSGSSRLKPYIYLRKAR